MSDTPGMDALAASALAQVGDLRVALECAATMLEVLELQLRKGHFTDPASLQSLAKMAATGAREAREALDPG